MVAKRGKIRLQKANVWVQESALVQKKIKKKFRLKSKVVFSHLECKKSAYYIKQQALLKGWKTRVVLELLFAVDVQIEHTCEQFHKFLYRSGMAVFAVADVQI